MNKGLTVEFRMYCWASKSEFNFNCMNLINTSQGRRTMNKTTKYTSWSNAVSTWKYLLLQPCRQNILLNDKLKVVRREKYCGSDCYVQMRPDPGLVSTFFMQYMEHTIRKIIQTTFYYSSRKLQVDTKWCTSAIFTNMKKLVLRNSIGKTTAWRINSCNLWATKPILFLELCKLPPETFGIIHHCVYSNCTHSNWSFSMCLNYEMSIQEESRDYYVWSKQRTMQNFASREWHYRHTGLGGSRREPDVRSSHRKWLWASRTSKRLFS